MSDGQRPWFLSGFQKEALSVLDVLQRKNKNQEICMYMYVINNRMNILRFYLYILEQQRIIAGTEKYNNLVRT